MSQGGLLNRDFRPIVTVIAHGIAAGVLSPRRSTTTNTPRHRLHSLTPTPMEFHIYREDSNDRSVKNKTKESVLYYIRSPWRFFSSPPKEVYRGELGKGSQIATIAKDGPGRSKYIIAFPGSQDVVVDHPGVFSNKSKFVFAGIEYVWDSDTKLIEVESGTVLARFERKVFAVKKTGVLSIYGKGVDMVDIIVLTGIAVQYRWQELRQ